MTKVVFRQTVPYLPAQPTPLIARSEELAAASRLLLVEGARLLTLTGPAGVGKTRLALAVAEEVLGSFPHGAWYVDLAPLSSPEGVPLAIARALGVQETGELSVIEVLAAYLEERRALLLLDNLEQLLPGAVATVTDLLSACPNVVVLATSRERLRSRWEHALAVPPLELPDLGGAFAREALSEVGSVRFFMERARASRPDMKLDAENGPPIAEICARLDGLPLALELAAARVGVLAPKEILGRLVPRLPSLGWKAPDVPERHRTLRAAFDWSYDLLSPQEQALFRRLGVFVGGWTAEAAEAIGEAHDLGLDTLDALESLVDKSLVRVAHAPGGEARFGMLETVREYALERLAERGELGPVQERHADHFLALAERAASKLRGEHGVAWQARLERDHDNLRAALSWAWDAGRKAFELRLAAALAYFWYMRSHIVEGRGRLEHALVGSAGCYAPSRVEVLTWSGYFAWAQADYGGAAPRYEEALSLARAGEDDRASVLPLAFMGKLAWPAGDYGRAGALQEEALALSRKTKARWHEAVVLAELGITRRLQGDDPGAAEMLQEALVLNEEAGNSYHLSQVLATLADLARERGDTARASALLEQSIALSWRSEHRGILTYGFSMATRLVAEHGNPESAASLLATAGVMDVISGWRRTPPEAATQAEAAKGVRAKLDGTAFVTASKAGRAMPLERVVEEALAELACLRTAGVHEERTGQVADRSQYDPLSGREREVLKLVAEGLLDRQIAETLFITERTARFHVASARAKLGANTRAQAVAKAVRLGLF